MLLWLGELAGRLVWYSTEGYLRFVAAMVTVTLTFVAVCRGGRWMAERVARHAADLKVRQMRAMEERDG